MYSKEEDFGNANINQFIRLNNRLRANGFLSIPFLPDIASPARSLVLNGGQIETGSESADYLRYVHPGVRLSEKLIQTSMLSHNLNEVATPQVLAQLQGQTDKFEITPGTRKYTDSEYSGINTDDLRTVGSILHNIYAERDDSFVKEQNTGLEPVVTAERPISARNKMEFPFDIPSNHSSGSGMKSNENARVESSIELSFANDRPDCSPPLPIDSESVELPHQRLIVDGNKLVSTIHNLLYELESRGERSVETINSERSQKNGLIEKLNLLKRKYEALEKENESLRMINQTLTEEEQASRRSRAQGRETPQSSTLSKLEREKQQLLVENSRLKQDILKLQEDDDKSRDKADQFLRSIRSNLENEREQNRAGMLSQIGSRSNESALTKLEKKKILQSHYLYSIIVGFEKSINYWKLQASGQQSLNSVSKHEEASFESNETESGNSRETASEKSFFEFCQENNISTSELMKRDKNLWNRGLYMLQNADKSELESIVRWSCRLLNISNFRNIPIQIGTLLTKSSSKSPKVTHVFESVSSKKISPRGNSREVLSIELHDRFYNHFKTLFDVLDDQDVIQASNSIYIQLRDFKKFFRSICAALSLDYKATSPTECLKILNDLLAIGHSKKAPGVQPQIQPLRDNSSSPHSIVESLKIVLDVDSNDQILPTLKQHLESQSAIILSLSKS